MERRWLVDSQREPMQNSRVKFESSDSTDIWGTVEIDGMWHRFMLSLETGKISMDATREVVELIRDELAQQISATRERN